MSISLNSFKEVHSIMNAENAVLVYTGDFDQEIIKSMLKYTEDKLESSGIDEMIKRKIFNVMVEMLQNITKHQYADFDAETKPIFLIMEEDEDFYLITGNLCKKETIEGLKSKIDKVNSMDSAEALKAYYKEARLASRISEVGGAGLGFIDMARKTGNKLEYNFMDINSGTYEYFILKTIINKNA
ncbi:SiaB family protein kinase [Paracrocinitomix mangrovi]|uniref:SiaB family protein kinase n=1 Tax=Paracrocinitomix mangrovi TaxID=2862509 RepID=UPI001C8D4155|nr:SiaB family protein kinase [Paracrocinitomix mangrovi]UKN01609.1 SiaB family protein kinase [Paracrocinitomix mangrovi]